MEEKETRNSKNYTKLNLKTPAETREETEEKNGNQKTDCVHKLY